MPSPESERLANSLAQLANVITKLIADRVDQTLITLLPVKIPSLTGDNPGDRILTKKQLAEVLQVSPRTITIWMQRRYLPYWKIGRDFRFRLSEVFRHFDDRKVPERIRNRRQG